MTLLDGVVADYDEARGYGELTQAGTGERWWFHCTAIADGTRTISAGDAVRFSLRPGHLGRYEAIDVRPR